MICDLRIPQGFYEVTCSGGIHEGHMYSRRWHISACTGVSCPASSSVCIFNAMFCVAAQYPVLWHEATHPIGARSCTV